MNATALQIQRECLGILAKNMSFLGPQAPRLTRWQRLKMWLKGEKPEPLFKLPVAAPGTKIQIRKPPRYVSKVGGNGNGSE